MKIEHQFLESDFNFPYWKIDTLILGTFNPSCGEKVDYYYGRCRNKFWRAIENVFEKEYCSLQNNFKGKIDLMKKHRFGCSDIIKSVKLKSELGKSKICGKGYSDNFLFTQKYVKLEYQFEYIKDYIIKNKVRHILNTWGKRNTPKNFQNNIKELIQFCNNNNINYIEKCPSPSGRSRTTLLELEKFYKKHLHKTL